MFNANVFSVLAVHIESKMIIFYVWTVGCKVSNFFSGKFCIRLCFRLENGCAALKVQSPSTSGAIWYIKGFPHPVGKFTNTSLPLRYSATAFSCCGLGFWTPNVEHTPETALTLVALARFFLLPPSVNARSLELNYSNYWRRANKLTRQPIRATTRFISQCLQTSLSRD